MFPLWLSIALVSNLKNVMCSVLLIRKMNIGGENSLPGRKLLFDRSKQRALACMDDEEYARAFANFIVALTIQSDIEDDLMNVFLYILGKLTAEYEEQENWSDILMCYQQAVEVLPHNSQILHGLATALFRQGHIQSATIYFQRAYKENPFFTPSLYCLENIKNSLVERWHFAMLNDKARNFSFKEAITKAVRDGCKTVLDIGSGTGIFSMMALDAGADKVYACEGSEVMRQIFRKVIKVNKKNIPLLEKFSHELTVPQDLPQKVSLVVTETFDACLFGERILHTLKHAWENLIVISEKDGTSLDNLSLDDNTQTILNGRVIPCSADLWAVPMECAIIRRSTSVDKQCFEALELPEVSVQPVICSDEPYSTERLKSLPGEFKYLSSPKPILKANFNDIQEITSLLKGKAISASFECSEAGQIDAIAVWFDLHLDKTISISTSPENETGCWEQAIFYTTPRHFGGSSQCTKIGDLIEISFFCEGHLNLKTIVTSSSGITESKLNSLSLDVAGIRQMNSMNMRGILAFDALAEVQQPNATVIDTSTVPLLGLKTLMNGAEKLIINPCCYLTHVKQLASLKSIPMEQIRVMSYEEICMFPVKCSLVISEPVEECGLLKKNVLEDIALLRTLNVEAPPIILPKKIAIYALLIESSDLVRNAKVVSDQNCDGYKISKYLNVYQCSVHQDIQLSTLKHIPLSEPKKLCSIDLNRLVYEKDKLQSFVDIRGSVKVKITRSGTVSAVPFWFDLSYSDQLVVNTFTEQSMFKQAACIQERVTKVIEGEIVSIWWYCNNSCLHMKVKKG